MYALTCSKDNTLKLIDLSSLTVTRSFAYVCRYLLVLCPCSCLYGSVWWLLVLAFVVGFLYVFPAVSDCPSAIVFLVCICLVSFPSLSLFPCLSLSVHLFNFPLPSLIPLPFLYLSDPVSSVSL